jgi:hypothetical protein
MVDLAGDLGGVVEFGDLARNLGAHVGEDVEVAIAKSVVKEHTVALGDGRGAANNVDNGNMFRVGTGQAIDGGKLAHTKSGDEGRDLGDSGITIGGVSSIELVDAANPLEAAVREIVEGNEVVVAWNAVDGAHTDFVESLEEVLASIDRLLESLNSFVGHDS